VRVFGLPEYGRGGCSNTVPQFSESIWAFIFGFWLVFVGLWVMFAPWPGDGDLKLRAAAASGPVSPEARDDWKDEVLPWLSDELAGKASGHEEEGPAPQARHRLASEDSVLALGNALRHCACQGLVMFQDKASDEHAGKDEQDTPGIRACAPAVR
jgi:hypothetical protein